MLNILPLTEQLPLKLRAIFESYGYKKYHMDKFEPYDMYRENKSFLKYDGIITFTNNNGKLMALKPDVTMSIIKNTPENEQSRKLYYNENVFRMQAIGGEYSEISQMGLEYIGGEDMYSQAEVVLIALKSLEEIEKEYILAVAHMGFINELFIEAGIFESRREECLLLIQQKNAHGIDEFCKKFAISYEYKNALIALISNSGSFLDVLNKISANNLNDRMKASLNELYDLYNAVDSVGLSNNLVLDFTVINDPDYYNGVVFQGFIPGTPRAVLSGGRYDNLMRRFGKPQNAIGFALYLGELDRALRSQPEFDTDLLLVYGDAGTGEVIKAVESLKDSYISIRAERTVPSGIKAKKILTLKEIPEVTKNA